MNNVQKEINTMLKAYGLDLDIDFTESDKKLEELNQKIQPLLVTQDYVNAIIEKETVNAQDVGFSWLKNKKVSI